MKINNPVFKLFNLSLQLNGFPLRKAKTELAKIVKFSEPDYNAFLDSKKKEIFEFHCNNNPYYKSLLGDKTIEKMGRHSCDAQNPFSETIGAALIERLLPKKMSTSIKLQVRAAIRLCLPKTNSATR